MNAAAPTPATAPSGRAGPGARQMDAGTMRAWDREWKRAEVAAWFRGTPAAHEQRSSDNGMKAPHLVAASPHAAQPSFITNRLPSVPGIRPCSTFTGIEGGATVMSTSARAFTRVANALPANLPAQNHCLHVADKVALPAVAMSSEGAPPRVATNSKADTAPVSRAASPIHPEPARAAHVHIELAADGVRVWLGIPAGEHGPDLGANALISELRRSLAARGYRLTSVICNGEEQP